MIKTGNRIGEQFETKTSGVVEIVEYRSSTDLDVKFLDDGSIAKNLKYAGLKRGTVRNHNIKRVYGVGYMGFGKYSFGSHKRLYKMWSKMFERSYCEIYHKTRPTYKGCSVDEKWHSFQDFVEWVKENYYEHFLNSTETLIIDKDIKVKGNKVYSPDNTFLVDNRINVLFTKSNKTRGKYPIGVTDNRFGRFECSLTSFGKTTYVGTFDTPEEAFLEYKKEKEKYIKHVANDYKDNGVYWMTDKLYNSMLSYEVEITD